MILLDTHILYWAAYFPERLSSEVREAWPEIERSSPRASAISVWEIGIKAKLGKLVLPEPLSAFVRRVRSTNVTFVAVTTQIWLRTAELDWPHRDPADRVIVSTAQLKRMSLLTADDVIRSSGLVQLA